MTDSTLLYTSGRYDALYAQLQKDGYLYVLTGGVAVLGSAAWIRVMMLGTLHLHRRYLKGIVPLDPIKRSQAKIAALMEKLGWASGPTAVAAKGAIGATVEAFSGMVRCFTSDAATAVPAVQCGLSCASAEHLWHTVACRHAV